ncbi:AAA family ATPase [Halobellus clavatus]|jgi:SpoVK/Ycf46/Vps4 family AAA+-type ATPase|uniref:Transitional endoplasmic reticulum ATPase n=1 Tax=Halobellus clavatus TaxID=660517 RepID=A0A1H3JL17_9EURY|nr:AAA family ATPase [Halobellus clavatus]SDY40225.1 transitional endoplasmic reticulum ATPase [Halobellus clavatus]
MTGAGEESPARHHGGDIDLDESVDVEPSSELQFCDIEGLEERKRRLRESVVDPAVTDRHETIGASGILIHGPSGVGKTHLARALIGELGFDQITITPTDLPLESPDETAQLLVDLAQFVRSRAPCVLFFDEFDAIAPTDDEDQYGRPSQVGAALKSTLDTIDAAEENVIVVATATHLSDVERTVRRSGRIDIVMGVDTPEESRRRQILATEVRSVTTHADALDAVEADIDFERCVELTSGFVTAEIVAAVERAGQIAIADAASEQARIDQTALRTALEEIGQRKGRREHSVRDSTTGAPDDEAVAHSTDREAQQDSPEASSSDARPGSQNDVAEAQKDSDDNSRGIEGHVPHLVGSPSIPDVTYDDIGGLDAAKRRLRESVVWPKKYPEQFDALDIDPPTGVLLHGPPGTGKTMLAKAVANESDHSFLSVKGPEIFDKHFGESEQAVRDLFRNARGVAPALIFFDEFDSIAAQRGGYSAGSDVTDSIVNQLLAELDGMDPLGDVIVIAATNRVDMLDPAVRRPGRFSIEIPVSRPDEAGREEIFQTHLQDRRLADEVGPEWLARVTDDRYSGADIAALCDEAAMTALRGAIDDGSAPETMAADSETQMDETPSITRADFQQALARVDPASDDRDSDTQSLRSYR